MVIPAYNEENAISKQIDNVKTVMEKTGWSYALIVVDDGSTDNTAKEAEKHDVKLIRLPRNSGYGAALKAGFAEADSEYIIIIDADGTYPADAIPNMLLKVPEFDMVVGARIGENTHVPFVMVEILRENIIICMLFLMGLVTLLRAGKARQLAILSLLLIVTVLLLYKNLWKQYFMFIVPLAGVIAGYALYSVFQNRVSRLIVILFAIYIPLGLMHNFSSVIQHRSFRDDTQSKQLDKVNYVLSLTDGNDKIYDGNININLFRDDIDYFWFCVGPDDCLDAYRKIAGYEYDIYELISEHKPRVVNIFAIDNPDDPRIKKHYRKSDRYDDILIRVD